jgi:hypothetical protein
MIGFFHIEKVRSTFSIECYAQDSHFWSSVDKAPEKPAMKLIKIVHISYSSEQTACRVRFYYVEKRMNFSYLLKGAPKGPDSSVEPLFRLVAKGGGAESSE